MPLRGTITALITPFKDGQLHEEGLIQNIRDQIDAGINGLLMLGSTGEAHTLSSEEQVRVITLTVNEAKGKVPVLVGTGRNCTQQTIEKSQQAQKLGADGIVVVTPYYNKPSQEGIFKHYEALSQNVSLPIYLYNVPGRSGINIELPTLLRLAGLPHLAGIKDASGSVSQMADTFYAIRQKHPEFSIFCGDDALTLPMMALGAKGVMSVVSNLVPQQVVELVKHAATGRFDLAQQLHYRLLPLFQIAFVEVNPVPIKAAMEMCGRSAGECRLPLCGLLPENRQKLLHVLQTMQLTK